MIEDLDQDGVTVYGQRVKRPSSVSVTQWYDFWEPLLNWPTEAQRSLKK
jgi:hypothetical protein